ncbi:MAG: putative bifunctional diguanylate cyclase/phosphodiesterase [Vulcanimicrobiaceae bacterium]
MEAELESAQWQPASHLTEVMMHATSLDVLLRDAIASQTMEHGIIGSSISGQFVVHAIAGETGLANADWSDYEATLGALAIARRSILDVVDSETSPECKTLGMSEACGLRSCIAMPFQVGDEQWSLVLTSSKERVKPLGADEYMYLCLLESMLRRALQGAPASADYSRLAFFDALTDLPNRTATLARLSEAVASAGRSGERVGLFYIDIDGFKKINDSHGHSIGDKVLATLSQRMRDTLRLGEYVGRIGGDEFAVVFPNVRKESELVDVATRLAEVVAVPVEIGDIRTECGASIGIAVFPDDASSAEDLLSNADVAMYRAKKQRDQRYCYYNGELEAELLKRRELTRTLQDADTNREFLLCYQPIMDKRRESVVGAEVLLRWMHPSNGLLLPASFLNIAHENHLMSSIDSWVIGAVLDQARRWKKAGTRLPLFVNVASFDPHIVDTIRLAVNSGKVDARQLCIEIREDRLAANFDQAAAFMRECAEIGVGVGLDRFGTGGVPISKLGELRLDFVKLDRRLGFAGAPMEAAVAIAKCFGWTMIAEGVESKQQRRWLEAQGVTRLQGFDVAYPMTVVDLVSWSKAAES